MFTIQVQVYFYNSVNIPVSVSGLSGWLAGSRGPSVSAARAAAWQRQLAPPSRPAGGSEPPEDLVWAGLAGPAAPQLAVQDSAQSVGCYQPANTDRGEVTLRCSCARLLPGLVWSWARRRVSVCWAQGWWKWWDHLFRPPQLSELTFRALIDLTATWGKL